MKHRRAQATGKRGPTDEPRLCRKEEGHEERKAIGPGQPSPPMETHQWDTRGHGMSQGTTESTLEASPQGHEIVSDLRKGGARATSNRVQPGSPINGYEGATRRS